jgi:hypothetical protein
LDIQDQDRFDRGKIRFGEARSEAAFSARGLEVSRFLSDWVSSNSAVKVLNPAGYFTNNDPARSNCDGRSLLNTFEKAIPVDINDVTRQPTNNKGFRCYISNWNETPKSAVILSPITNKAPSGTFMGLIKEMQLPPWR